MYGVQASQRSLYLTNFAQQLILKFPYLKHYAKNQIGVGAGFPPSQARGRVVRPAYLHSKVNGWHGVGTEEDGFLHVHPAWLNSPERAGKGILYGLSKAVSPRWGMKNVGLEWDGQEILCTPETGKLITSVIEEVGAPPEGFADLFPVRNVQRTRNRKYECPSGCLNPESNKVISFRIASDTLGATFVHQPCGAAMVLVAE